MKLVQIFLPLYDNAGKKFPAQMYAAERDALVKRFGGITAYMRAPAKGLWNDRGKTAHDDMVILEVMVRRLDRKWWNDHRNKLQKRFRQKELVVRSQDTKLL
jgi:hypothetical protein